MGEWKGKAYGSGFQQVTLRPAASVLRWSYSVDNALNHYTVLLHCVFQDLLGSLHFTLQLMWTYWQLFGVLPSATISAIKLQEFTWAPRSCLLMKKRLWAVSETGRCYWVPFPLPGHTGREHLPASLAVRLRQGSGQWKASLLLTVKHSERSSVLSVFAPLVTLRKDFCLLEEVEPPDGSSPNFWVIA